MNNDDQETSDTWLKLEAITRDAVAFLQGKIGRSSKGVSGLSCAGVPLEPTTTSTVEREAHPSGEAQAEFIAAASPDEGSSASVRAAAHSPGINGETDLSNLDRSSMSFIWAVA